MMIFLGILYLVSGEVTRILCDLLKTIFIKGENLTMLLLIFLNISLNFDFISKSFVKAGASSPPPTGPKMNGTFNKHKKLGILKL